MLKAKKDVRETMLVQKTLRAAAIIAVVFFTLSPGVALLAQPTDDATGHESDPSLVGFVLIEAGVFTMGSPPDESGVETDEPQRVVTLTRDFYVQVHEVTQAQWQELMGNNPSLFSECGDECPVENVNWYEAVAYANALSREAGLEECVELNECEGQPGEGMECSSVTFVGLDCEGFRLPTEAEWEYAARAGTDTAFHNGPMTQTIRENYGIAWYRANSHDSTHPVGEKNPNDWGLYDISGNVMEWVWDWYDGIYYSLSPADDPLGFSNGSMRVIRGGSWDMQAISLRSARRVRGYPEAHTNELGFRLARSGTQRIAAVEDDGGGAQAVDNVEVLGQNLPPGGFVLVEAGTFTMGSTPTPWATLPVWRARWPLTCPLAPLPWGWTDELDQQNVF